MTVDLFAELSAEQESLLRVIVKPAEEYGVWPTWQYVDTVFSRTGGDALEVLKSLPKVRSVYGRSVYGLVGVNNRILAEIDFDKIDKPADDDDVCLAISAALHLPELVPVANEFLGVLRVLVDRMLNSEVDPLKVSQVTITSGDLQARLHFLDPNDLMLMEGWLFIEPVPVVDLESDGDDYALHRDELKLFRGVEDIADYVRRVISWVAACGDEEKPAVIQSNLASIDVSRPSYVDQTLIEKLESAQAATKWNLKKFLQLLRELNENYALGHAYASHTLLRAIIDHVPPIFGKGNFKSVVEQYGWSATDKKYMKRLEDFRGQGDDALHRMIREREDILDFEDMPPRVLINRLIDEVVALLNAGTP